MQSVPTPENFTAWRASARRLLNARIAPEEVLWDDGLGLGASQLPSEGGTASRVPREFLSMAETVACHRDPARWALLYRLLWRLTHGEPHLLEVIVDENVHRLRAMEKAVARDVHKMRAFVRFRHVHRNGNDWHVAWFEPEHHIVERNAPFFRDRFAGMNWSILTPERCAHWDRSHLTFSPGVTRDLAPREDAVGDLWLRYYSSIFNPARVKVGAMLSEMPRKYWKNLPETAAIPSLLADAPARSREMISCSQADTAPPVVGPSVPQILSAAGPSVGSLTALHELAMSCRACPLHARATNLVFGEGPPDAAIVFVGEQPGDQEDIAGRPFVGPAGKLFDRALADAGIDREEVYVTNAVKHFKWEPRGKRRIHQKPDAAEMAACKPWLTAELSILRPNVLVCLGATAATSVLGADIKVLRDRGVVRESQFCKQTLVTVHPSSLLRVRDEQAKRDGYTAFVADLQAAAGLRDFPR